MGCVAIRELAVVDMPGLPTLDEPERIGVARFTWGGGLARRALDAAVAAAEAALTLR